MKKHSLSENILICLAAAFVGGVWQYEMYLGETVHRLMCAGSLLLTAAVWMVISFSEGRIKRKGFAVFTLLFCILPQIPIIYAENSDYNEVADAASRLGILFTRSAFSAVFGNDSIICPITAAVLCLASFAAGMLITVRKEKAIASENNSDVS